MAAKQLDTSISDAKAREFLAVASERESLWCKKITGFHLIKLKTGGSWRYRYQTAAGQRRAATIGKYPTMKPAQAAEFAVDWRNNGVDVLANKQQIIDSAVIDANQKKHRIVRAYLKGPYTRHQDRKKSGHETLAIIRHSFADYLDRDMSTLTRSDISEWQRKREAQGRAHATLQRAYGALKTMIKHAVNQHPPVLSENPLKDVNLEKPTDNERNRQLSEEKAAVRRLLTDPEIQGLHGGLSAFTEQLRAQRQNSRRHGKPHLPDFDSLRYPHWFVPFAYVALYTGMRPGDIYGLTWLELNMNFKRITKTLEKTRHHSDPARIVLDMPAPLYEIMNDWWKQHGKPDTGLVFPSPITGRRLDKKAHGKPWATVKKLGGLPDISFYALRHHFISTLVAAGVPLLTVARLVGHKSVAMIERHYGHISPASSSNALKVFSDSVARKEIA